MKPASDRITSLADIEATARLREVSGRVQYPSSDWLTGFLYVLMRDAAPTGEVERIVRELEQEQGATTTTYTNGWLAQYAKDLAERLRAIGQP